MARLPRASGAAAADGTGSNRRMYPRRKKPFRAMYFGHAQERKPAIGLDISGGGLRILVKDEVEHQGIDLPVVVLIADRPVQLQAKVKWVDRTQHQGEEHFLYGLKLSRIADHEWDRIMDWTLEEAAGTVSPELRVGSVLTAVQRDSMIPIPRQVEIAKKLAEKGRLDAIAGGRLPLVEYKFEGFKMRMGIPYYKMTVRSKKTERDQSATEYRTSVLARIESEGVVVLD
jgi:hypothetical protein